MSSGTIPGIASLRRLFTKGGGRLQPPESASHHRGSGACGDHNAICRYAQGGVWPWMNSEKRLEMKE
jgi:hypothetical protein